MVKNTKAFCVFAVVGILVLDDNQESHTEKIGVGKKVKRLSNKRERGQVKNYLKGYSIEDYENLDEDEGDLEERVA